MKRGIFLLAALALVGCGNDAGENNGDSLTIDTDASDAGATASDAGGDDQTDDASNGAEDIGDYIDPTGFSEVLLEDTEVEITDGESGRIGFTVPDSTRAIVVSVRGAEAENFTLAYWKNGDGNELVPTGWVDQAQSGPSLCLACPNRVAASEASFAALAPNNPQVEVVPGGHQVALVAYEQAGLLSTTAISTTATVRVIAKVRDEEPASGVIDLNLYFTGARGLTAEEARTGEEFQQTLDGVRQLYDQVGLTIGQVHYRDIGEEYQVIEDVMLPESDLQEMFALSADNPRNAINVFFVDEILSGGALNEFGVVKGISGGIPGPPMSGTHRSGVALALKDDPRAPVPLYKVMAHEVGHHLGLFHTSEQAIFGGQVHDQLDDTPRNDESNLMYHAGNGDVLTASQGEVMRLNPWIRHHEQ